MSVTRQSEPRHIFVYGTLKRSFSNPYARLLRAHARFVSEAWVQGELVNLGPYPGLVPAPNGRARVFGELFRLDDANALLRQIDRYEGCDPDEPGPRPFVRRTAFAHLMGGGTELAWVYYFSGATLGRPPIRSGRFEPYRRAPRAPCA